MKNPNEHPNIPWYVCTEKKSPINKNKKRQLKNPPVIDEFPIETSIYHGFPDYQRAIFHSYPMIPFMNRDF